jgi:hypothetical protein
MRVRVRGVAGTVPLVYRDRVMGRRRSTSLSRWRRAAVRRMVASREATLAFIARLPEPEILRRRTQDQWSVKDVLGHLLSCDEETVRRFALIARGQAHRIHWFESMADADRFNARTVARTRKLGLRTVLRRMARVRADMIARFERLPEDALADPSHAYPVTDWLPAPGWSHENDHVADVRAWWSAHRAPGRPARNAARRSATRRSSAASRRRLA